MSIPALSSRGVVEEAVSGCRKEIVKEKGLAQRKLEAFKATFVPDRWSQVNYTRFSR
jgi:hypothetical protein